MKEILLNKNKNEMIAILVKILFNSSQTEKLSASDITDIMRYGNF